MDALKSNWFDAPVVPTQKHLVDEMQLSGLKAPPFIPLGQYFIPCAYRAGMTGFVDAPITAMWNVRKG